MKSEGSNINQIPPIRSRAKAVQKTAMSLFLVAAFVSAAYACMQKCEGCLPCTTTGALAFQEQGSDGCWDKTFWNSTTYSDSCYNLLPPKPEQPHTTGATNCYTIRQAFQGTVTVQDFHYVHKVGCLLYSTDPNVSYTWHCDKAVLEGDGECTN